MRAKSQGRISGAVVALLLWAATFARNLARVQVAGLLIGAALLAASAVAQQEVSPEHFDAKPNAAQSLQPANARKKQAAGSYHARQAKQKPASRTSAVFKAEAETAQTNSNPR